MFFCVRVYYLIRSKPLSAIAFALTLMRLAFHICVLVFGISGATFAVFRTAQFKWALTGMLVLGAVSDVAITLSICWALSRMRSGITSSDKLVDKLLALTVGMSEYPRSD